MHDDADHVQAALDGGAAGYIVKDSVEEELVAAIESVAHGSTYVHPRLGAVLAQAARGPQDPLTDREREVARLVALGYTNQEIAGQIYVSVRTVETHRAHVMAKLSLATRAELVRWALDNGLVE
jgi:Response regulator containing a CheY-like receiver domain and an HTH DNA-binding domain